MLFLGIIIKIQYYKKVIKLLSSSENYYLQKTSVKILPKTSS
jgi:hypothetical protein